VLGFGLRVNPNPLTPRPAPCLVQAAAAACRELLRWLRREEKSLFMLSAK